MSESSKKSKGLSDFLPQMFRRKRQTPNPKHARIKAMIDEVHLELWGEYYKKNPKAISRIDAYKNSIEQHFPRLAKIGNEEELRTEIETMFRARAERKTRPSNAST